MVANRSCDECEGLGAAAATWESRRQLFQRRCSWTQYYKNTWRKELNVRAGRGNDVQVQLGAQGQEIVYVSVAIKVIDTRRWGVIAPVEVDSNAVQAHAFVVLQKAEPALAVWNAPILKFS